MGACRRLFHFCISNRESGKKLKPLSKEIFNATLLE